MISLWLRKCFILPQLRTGRDFLVANNVSTCTRWWVNRKTGSHYRVQPARAEESLKETVKHLANISSLCLVSIFAPVVVLHYIPPVPCPPPPLASSRGSDTEWDEGFLVLVFMDFNYVATITTQCRVVRCLVSIWYTLCLAQGVVFCCCCCSGTVHLLHACLSSVLYVVVITHRVSEYP